MKRLAAFLISALACFAQVQSGQTYHGILATGQSLSTGCGGYVNDGSVKGGTAYQNNLMLTAGTTVLEGPSGATVNQITQASGGVPASVTLAGGGSGYTTAPGVVVDGDGTGGGYTATISGGAVTALTRTAAGTGYTKVQIFIQPPTTATSVLENDGTPLIPLVNSWKCNNSSGDASNSTRQPQDFPSLFAANQLTYMTGGATGNRYILAEHGMSGRSYAAIGGPTDTAQPPVSNFGPFKEGQLQLSAINSAVAAASSTFVLDALMLTHGEQDGIVYNRHYASDLTHLQWDYETASNAALSRVGVLPMFISQENSWGEYHGSGSVPISAVQQWQAAENNPGRIYLTGPIYQTPYNTTLNDGVHRNAAGYQQVGEVAGKAMYNVLVLGKYWTPVMPKTITISGATITAKFFVPVGPLQIDTTTVAAQTNDGFEFTDGRTALVNRIYQPSGGAPASVTIADGGSGYASAPTVTVSCGGCGATYIANISGGTVTSLTQTAAGSGATVIDILIAAPTPSVTISNVSVSSDTVTITLSGTPTGPSPTLRYAYTAPAAIGGGKGNLKDSDTSTGRVGSALYDWCVTFDAPIPFTSKLLNARPAAAGGARISGGTAH